MIPILHQLPEDELLPPGPELSRDICWLKEELAAISADLKATIIEEFWESSGADYRCWHFGAMLKLRVVVEDWTLRSVCHLR